METRATIIITVMLLALDRAAKLAAQRGLVEGWSFFDFYPRLTFHQNYGIAFDILIPRGITIAASALILVALIALAIRAWSRRTISWVPLLLIIVGASSNLFDRIQFGYVIDMIEVFPRSIWNIADIMIVVGLVFLIMRGAARGVAEKSIEKY